MIYNKDTMEDLVNVLTFIDSFTVEAGVEDVQVDSKACHRAILGSRRDFPYVAGVDKASVFKKVANFVAYFIASQPIKSAFPESAVGPLFEFDPNAIIAYHIAVVCLEESKICSGNGEEIRISKPITVSDHSYIDILGALSRSDIQPETHFELLAVFFEQLTYKCNPQCQYPDDKKYYPPLKPGGDECYGV